MIHWLNWVWGYLLVRIQAREHRLSLSLLISRFANSSPAPESRPLQGLLLATFPWAYPDPRPLLGCRLLCNSCCQSSPTEIIACSPFKPASSSTCPQGTSLHLSLESLLLDLAHIPVVLFRIPLDPRFSGKGSKSQLSVLLGPITVFGTQVTSGDLSDFW